MRTYKMFACLFLSALALLNGYSLNANAESDSSSLEYIAMYDTGEDSWQNEIAWIQSLIGNADTYVVYLGASNQLNVGWNLNSNGSLGLTGSYCLWNLETESQLSCSSSTYTAPIGSIIAMHINEPYPTHYSARNIVNVNGVTWEQALSLYENGNSTRYQAIIDAINGQWSIDDGEDFGAYSIVTELEGKLGVLGFASDTLIQFVDLFDSSYAGSTTLTFPAFSLNVQGQNYTIWDEVSFDLNSIYNDFSFLIDTVRTILTLFVWLAVFNYCVKSYERVVNR